jgi:hypothetical protein
MSLVAFMAFRSTFLRHSLACTAPRASLSCDRSTLRSCVRQAIVETHVIVGAGLAGVATAYLLLVRMTSTSTSAEIGRGSVGAVAYICLQIPKIAARNPSL